MIHISRTPRWGTAVAVALLAASATAAAAGADRAPAAPAPEKIAFSSNRTGQDEIVVANADGSDRVDLNAQGRLPEFSPDGRKIAFSSTRDGNSEIYVMNADGSNQTRLTFNTLYDSRPQWSADGRKLVFTRLTADGNWEIFRMRADGSDQVDLTNNPAVEWGQSTLGDRIVFTREEAGVGHIFVMNIDGRGLRRITNTSSYDSYPNLSPGGDLVLFVRDAPGGTGDDIWVTRDEGRGERQLTHQSAAGYVVEPAWSPDGSQIMYSQCGGPLGASPCVLHVMNADGSNDHDISTPKAPWEDTFTGRPARLDVDHTVRHRQRSLHDPGRRATRGVTPLGCGSRPVRWLHLDRSQQPVPTSPAISTSRVTTGCWTGSHRTESTSGSRRTRPTSRSSTGCSCSTRVTARRSRPGSPDP